MGESISKMLQFGVGGSKRLLGLLAVRSVSSMASRRSSALAGLRIEDLAGIEQHHFPSHPVKFVRHLEIAKHGVGGKDVFQQLAQLRNIPLSVPQVVDQTPFRLLGVADWKVS